MTEEALQRFMQSKDRAKRLIQMDANGKLDNITENLQKNQKIDYSLSETPLVSENAQPKEAPSSYMTQQMASKPNTKSKLPKEILESFAKNNIDTSMLGVSVGQSSVLDQIDKLTNGGVFKEEKKVEQPTQRIITENAPMTNNVDYSMIKMIVEDCVKKYTSSLRKSLLNESKTTNDKTLQALKIGNKFTFIDNQGNLYEAQMKFIRNINDKK